MKKIRFASLLLALMVVLSTLAGCSTQPGAANAQSTAASGAVSSAAQALTVTDMAGQEVTLPQTVTRVVALSPSDCEILYALGAGDKIVARGEYCDWPAEVQQVESVGTGNETNLEQIIALEPQIVFMNAMAQTVEQVQRLNSAGIAVVVSNAADIAGVYQSIELIGTCMGLQAEAAVVAADMKAGFEEAAALVPDDAKETRVYFEVSPLEYGLWTAGSDTFMSEIADMLQLTNVFSDLSGWAAISQEQVIERNPDYIISITMYFGEGPTPEEEIASRDGWNAIAAVQSGNVFTLDADEMSRPGPRLANAARSLAVLIYGEYSQPK